LGSVERKVEEIKPKPEQIIQNNSQLVGGVDFMRKLRNTNEADAKSRLIGGALKKFAF
jgi:hypothetical protein